MSRKLPYAILPRRGLVGLDFGSPRVVVVAYFGSGAKSFRRGDESHPSDFWSALGVFAYYDPSGRVEALEFTSPAQVAVGSFRLLPSGLADAFGWLRSADPEGTIEEAGGSTVYSVISTLLGVGVWSPVGDEGAAAETVIAFRDGYYD